MKKLLGLFLAALLCSVFTLSAFADDDLPGSQETQEIQEIETAAQDEVAFIREFEPDDGQEEVLQDQPGQTEEPQVLQDEPDDDPEEPVAEPKNGWIEEDGSWFYYTDDIYATDWKQIPDGGAWYYFDADGKMQTGLIEINGNWYYLKDSGKMATGWQEIAGKWYLFGNTGKALTGWYKSDNKWYFLKAKGEMAAAEWQKDNGSWYYLNASGVMVTGWQYIDGDWYYLESSGKMLKGWFKYKNKWYFLKSSGAMASAEWVKSGDKWYYLKENGIMAAKEWVESSWWVNKDGVWDYKYKASWQKNSTGWWFGDTSGWYAKGTTTTIDGVRYLFNSYGYLVGKAANQEVVRLADSKLDICGWDLYKAYCYVVENNTYTKAGHGSTTSENAIYSYKTGVADCIGFASAFCFMARSLGYECVVLHGEVPYASGGYGEHAWCEIIVGGKVYWVDTQFAYQTGRNGYLFNYGQSGTWVYRNWTVMKDF